MLRAFTLPECPSPSLRRHLANLKKSADIIHLAAARLLITAGQTATRIICLMAETGEFGWSRTISSRVRSDLVAYMESAARCLLAAKKVAALERITLGQ